VHRAEIIRLRGAWAEALDEANQAYEELRNHSLLDQAGEAFKEIGTIRLRMGDLDAAEEAFAQAHELGSEPASGLALLRLAQGKPEAAGSIMARALTGGYLDRLARAQLLPTHVQIALALGDLETARAAVREMEEISEQYAARAIHAATHQARGALLLAEGDPGAARADLELARKHWKEADAPYEGAHARLLLAEAFVALGDRDGATMEVQAASSAFDRLGATLDVAACADFLARMHEEAAAPERLVRTLMFTDIVKSTNLLEAIGEEGWQDLLRWHDQTMASRFAEHRGEVVKHTGDGFFVAFESADDAVACAVAVQRSLAEHRRSHGFAPQVRIGLHAAETSRSGGDYSGRGVHQAARIGALADGGEILASHETIADCQVDVPVSPPRPVSLKGISDTVEIVSVDWR
jgi:class 3 adenylate cyclase